MVLVIFRVKPRAERHLPKAIQTSRRLSLVFGFGERRQQHRGQDSDNGNDDQKLDQREGGYRSEIAIRRFAVAEELFRAGGHEPTLHPPGADVKPPALAT
jgi:hypothetical protein